MQKTVPVATTRRNQRPHERNWRGRLLAALSLEAPLPELLSIVAIGLAENGPVAIFCAPEPGAGWRCMAASENGIAAPVLRQAEELLARWRRAGARSPRSLTARLRIALDSFQLGVANAALFPGNTGVILAFTPGPVSPALAARLQRRARLAGWLCRSERALRAERTNGRLLEAAVAHVGAGIARYDCDAVIQETNDAFAAMLACKAPALRGKSFMDLLTNEEDVADARAGLARLLEGQTDSLEARRRLRFGEHGREVLVRLSTHLLRSRHGVPEAIVDIVTDIGESEALSAALAHERMHDPLTGLLNRAAFEARVEKCLDPDAAPCALAVVDLDRFGLVNASFGTRTGDVGLARVAGRLRAALRPGEAAGRLGNDEFGLVLAAPYPAFAAARAERMARLIHGTPVTHDDGESVRMTASIGVVPLIGSDVATMLRQAEQAARRARDAGGNQVRVYHAGDPAYSEADRTLSWAAQVQVALDEGRLALARQPIRALGSERRLPAHEYLVRMVGRDGDLIAPGEFLAAAEYYAMAREIDRWVIDSVLARLGAEPDAFSQLEFASVNLSGQSLDDPDLGLYVLAALARHGVPAEKFCLELTETAAVADIAAARSLIRILRAAGCRFALDDFGSGMASFGYLRDLDVDFVKIDGRFVRNMAANHVDRGMVEAMHEIARLTEKRTIAEFVEGPEALECLREIGVDYAQGYALGRPEPVAAAS